MFKTINRPFKQGDRVHTPGGWGTITGEFNNDPEKVGHWEVLLEDTPISGVKDVLTDFHFSFLRHETFLEFCTRPTGFGRTSWVVFALIQAFVVALVVAGIVTWSDDGWVAHLFAGAIEGVLIMGTYLNYTKKVV